MEGFNMNKEEYKQLANDWQDTIDLMAQIIDVPAGLIMRLTEGELEVFVSSKTKGNPYTVGEKEVMKDSGLYCETVINTNKMLLVPNALKENDWKNNPDVKLNMISYLGFPISWPDGKPFGTICVLDEKENHYSSQYINLIQKFRRSIEIHLELIDKSNQLTKLAKTDPLTSIYNRRGFFAKAETEFNRSIRYKHPLSILLFDIDNFKKINDTYGHQMGDEILTTFARTVSSLLRESDIFGRYGGDEYIAVLCETDYESAKITAERIRNEIARTAVTCNGNQVNFTVSIGIGSLSDNLTLSEIIKQADIALYESKNKGKNS